jgi:hypothetical protein
MRHPIITDKTWDQIRQDDAKRLAKIRDAGFRIELAMACKVEAQRKKNPEMDAFFKEVMKNHKGRKPIFSPREGIVTFLTLDNVDIYIYLHRLCWRSYRMRHTLLRTLGRRRVQRVVNRVFGCGKLQ